MRGFHPDVLERRYAGGGLAHGFRPVKAKTGLADGGVVRDPQQPVPVGRMDKDAVMAAIAARNGQAQRDTAQAQTLPTVRDAIGQIARGFFPVLARRGERIDRETDRATGYADGGRVRPRGFMVGPGTGTSDSIPARLSHGEYVLPADTTRAVGVKKLDALRAATHTPTRDKAGHRGDVRHFADGGVADDAPEPQRPVIRGADGVFRGRSGDVLANQDPKVNQIPLPPGAQPQTVGDVASARIDSSAVGDFLDSDAGRNILNTLSALPGGAGQSGRALAATGSRVAGFLGRAAARAAPVVAPAGLAGVTLNGMADDRAARDEAFRRNGLLPTVVVSQGQGAPSTGTAAPIGDASSASRAPAAEPTPAATPVNGITKTVDANGNVTYSGTNIDPNATINGATSGTPSANAVAAADDLIRRNAPAPVGFGHYASERTAQRAGLSQLDSQQRRRVRRAAQRSLPPRPTRRSAGAWRVAGAGGLCRAARR